jgi:hypothetical protein
MIKFPLDKITSEVYTMAAYLSSAVWVGRFSLYNVANLFSVIPFYPEGKSGAFIPDCSDIVCSPIFPLFAY